MAYLVGGLEHFLFPGQLGIIIPTGFHIFQRGWNHQPDIITQFYVEYTSGQHGTWATSCHFTTWDAPPNGLDQEVWGKNMLVLHLKFLVTLWGCGMTNKFMIVGCLVVFCAKAGFFSKKMSWTWFGYVWFFCFPSTRGISGWPCKQACTRTRPEQWFCNFESLV